MIIRGKLFVKLLRGLGSKAAGLTNIKYDLQQTDVEYDEAEYMALALANGLFFFVLFLGLLIFLHINQGMELQEAVVKAILYALGIGGILMFTMIRYPQIIAGKKAELIDRHLVFALKDLRLQVSSGVSLYNALVSISRAGYGQASKEFEKVAKKINSGTPLDKAFEMMAIETKSEFLKKTTWQLINTLKAGASVKGALSTLIYNLTIDKKDKIRKFSSELNLWILAYMLFAVAVPTIGATLLIILSSFAGFGVTKAIFIVFVSVCFIIQVILIGFVKSRRPVVVM